jgi:hypothetical protein
LALFAATKHLQNDSGRKIWADCEGYVFGGDASQSAELQIAARVRYVRLN